MGILVRWRLHPLARLRQTHQRNSRRNEGLLMSALDDFAEDGDNVSIDQFRMCHCGCPEDEHGVSGRCLHCGECESFEFDEEGTLAMLATVRDHDLPI